MRFNPIAFIKQRLPKSRIHRLWTLSNPFEPDDHHHAASQRNDDDVARSGLLAPNVHQIDHIAQHLTPSHIVQRNGAAGSPMLSSIEFGFVSRPERTSTTHQGMWQNVPAPTNEPTLPSFPPAHNQYYPPPLVWDNIDLPPETRLFPEQFVSVSSGMQTIISAGTDEYLVLVVREVNAVGGSPGQIKIIAPDAFFPLESMRHITVLFGTRAFLVRVIERLSYTNSAAPPTPAQIPSHEILRRQSQSSEYCGPLLQDPRTRTQGNDAYIRDLDILGMEEGILADSPQVSFIPIPNQDEMRFRPFDGSSLPLPQGHRPLPLPIQRPYDEEYGSQLCKSDFDATAKQRLIPLESLASRDPEQSNSRVQILSQLE